MPSSSLPEASSVRHLGLAPLDIKEQGQCFIARLKTATRADDVWSALAEISPSYARVWETVAAHAAVLDHGLAVTCIAECDDILPLATGNPAWTPERLADIRHAISHVVRMRNPTSTERATAMLRLLTGALATGFTPYSPELRDALFVMLQRNNGIRTRGLMTAPVCAAFIGSVLSDPTSEPRDVARLAGVLFPADLFRNGYYGSDTEVLGWADRVLADPRLTIRDIREFLPLPTPQTIVIGSSPLPIIMAVLASRPDVWHDSVMLKRLGRWMRQTETAAAGRIRDGFAGAPESAVRIVAREYAEQMPVAALAETLKGGLDLATAWGQAILSVGLASKDKGVREAALLVTAGPAEKPEPVAAKSRAR